MNRTQGTDLTKSAYNIDVSMFLENAVGELIMGELSIALTWVIEKSGEWLRIIFNSKTDKIMDRNTTINKLPGKSTEETLRFAHQSEIIIPTISVLFVSSVKLFLSSGDNGI